MKRTWSKVGRINVNQLIGDDVFGMIDARERNCRRAFERWHNELANCDVVESIERIPIRQR